MLTTNPTSVRPQSTADLPIIVRDRRRKGFFTIDNELLDRFGAQLKAHGLAVYMALARFANQDSTCWPSLATISRKTGVSRPQVIREITKLKALNLIAVEHQVNEKGEYSSNIYTLLDISAPPPDPEVVSARDQGSLSQTPPLVSARDQGSLSQIPKQNPGNKTQHRNKTQRTTRARNDHNNNSDSSTASSVVVAFSPSSSKQENIEENPHHHPENAAQIQPAASVTDSPIPLDPPSPATPSQAAHQALLALGIGKTVAQRLATRYHAERILEKIEFLAFLQVERPDAIENPRGWLRCAIEEDYGPPDGYKSQAERDAEAAAQQRQEEAMQQALAAEQRRAEEAHERQQQAEAARRLHLEQTYGTTQRELDVWRQCLDEFKLTMPAATFQACMADTLLLSLQDGEALIGLPNPGARDWVENRLTRKIGRILAAYVSERKITVKFVDLCQMVASQ